MKIQIAIEVPDELVHTIISMYEESNDPKKKLTPETALKRMTLAESIQTKIQLTVAKKLQLKLKNIFSKIKE